jgi:hypothetical protein
MCNEHNRQFHFYESKCSRCGNEYPEFNVVDDGQFKNKGYYPNCDCLVEIKLKKWQIPLLLGAAGLGEYYERACGRLAVAAKEGEDSREKVIPFMDESFLWRKHVDSIINQIKHQSGINLEYWECAYNDEILSAINIVVDKEVNKRISKYYDFGIDRSWLSRDFPMLSLR